MGYVWIGRAIISVAFLMGFYGRAVCAPDDSQGPVSHCENPALQDTRLFTAIEGNDLAMVKRVLKTGVSPNFLDEDGRPALVRALVLERNAIARYLVGRGADVRMADSFGMTPLHCVSDASLARYLVKKGAGVEARDKEFAMTPLFYAKVPVARVLIANGALVNAKAKKNMTPLMWHTYNNHGAGVKLLVASGARLSDVNDEGSAAVDIAERFGYEAIHDFLVAQQQKQK